MAGYIPTICRASDETEICPVLRLGKNKSRVVTADLSCYAVLETWKFISNHTKPDDYVFGNKDGSPAEFDNAIFKRLLRDLGLLKDKKEKNGR